MTFHRIDSTRLRQSLADVPGSVTIITAEMLKRFGIVSIPEALRLVPGMAVTQVSGTDYRIGYHGTNILVPRRMNVLIDGMSVYRPALAPWIGRNCLLQSRRREDRGSARTRFRVVWSQFDASDREHHHQASARSGGHDIGGSGGNTKNGGRHRALRRKVR